jgi:uncharacterized membrane protein YfcA
VEFVIIPAVALLASLLAFFSGFGLGTILLPAFAVFFPINVAVALTAIVHLLNNVFRFALVGRHVSKSVVVRFGLITVVASFAGAQLLSHLVDLKPLLSYRLFGGGFDITPVKLIVAILILVFALWETLPHLRRVSFSRKFLPLGGLLSGFFGGLSGHQGPLRSAFLANSGLTAESFIATNAAIAIMVDVPRIAVYATGFSLVSTERNAMLLVVTTMAGFLGALLGNLWLKKVTMRVIQAIVSVMLMAAAIALGSGLI